MLILVYKSFQVATPCFAYQHYLHLELTLMSLEDKQVTVTTYKYQLLWEKFVQIFCAQVMEYVK